MKKNNGERLVCVLNLEVVDRTGGLRRAPLVSLLNQVDSGWVLDLLLICTPMVPIANMLKEVKHGLRAIFKEKNSKQDLGIWI